MVSWPNIQKAVNKAIQNAWDNLEEPVSWLLRNSIQSPIIYKTEGKWRTRWWLRQGFFQLYQDFASKTKPIFEPLFQVIGTPIASLGTPLSDMKSYIETV